MQCTNEAGGINTQIIIGYELDRLAFVEWKGFISLFFEDLRTKAYGFARRAACGEQVFHDAAHWCISHCCVLEYHITGVY